MVRSLEKAFQLLEQLESSRYQELRLLAAGTGIAKSTLCRLLKTLERSGYVENNGRGGYRIGQRLLELGRPSPQKDETAHHALKSCVALAEATGESAVIATLSRRRIVIIAQARSQSSDSAKLSTYRNLSFWRSTSGRVLLAFLEPEELASLTRVIGFPGHLWENAEDLSALSALLGPIRRAGVSVMDNRSGRFTALSRPFFDASGRLCGCIGMTVEHCRYQGREHEIGEALRRSARALTELNREYNLSDMDWRKR